MGDSRMPARQGPPPSTRADALTSGPNDFQLHTGTSAVVGASYGRTSDSGLAPGGRFQDGDVGHTDTMSDTTTGNNDGIEQVADDPSSVEGWNFEALNERARELRAIVREGGLEQVMSEVAGEKVWLAPTGERINLSGRR